MAYTTGSKLNMSNADMSVHLLSALSVAHNSQIYEQIAQNAGNLCGELCSCFKNVLLFWIVPRADLECRQQVSHLPVN